MFSGLLAYLFAAGGGLTLLFAAYFKGRLASSARERDRHAAEERRARDIADRIDDDVGAMPPASAREELRRWAR